MVAQVQELEATSRELQGALDRAATRQPPHQRETESAQDVGAACQHTQEALPSPDSALTGLAAELKVCSSTCICCTRTPSATSAG